MALANPLDYHTFIWGDLAAMTAAFAAILDPDLALGCVVLDFPRADRCDASDWHLVIDAVAAARDQRDVPLAILASIADTLPEEVAEAILERGLVPLAGITEALEGDLGRGPAWPTTSTTGAGPACALNPRDANPDRGRSQGGPFGIRTGLPEKPARR